MKKKYAGIIALLLVVCFMLTGCGLFVKDEDRYLAETIATVEYADGTTETINREDFIEYYNLRSVSLYNYYYPNYLEQISYYESIYSQLGMTYSAPTFASYLSTNKVDTSAETALELFINRKCLIKEALTLYPSDLEDDKVINYIWSQVYSALDGYLDAYADDILEKRNAVTSGDGGTSTSTEEETAKTLITEYSKIAYLTANNTIVVKAYEDYIKEINDTDNILSSIGTIDDYIANYKYVYEKDDESGSIAVEAMKDFIKALKNDESGRDYSDTSSEAVLKRKVQRLYSLYTGDYLVSKVQADKIQGSITISKEQVVVKYQELLLADYENYTINTSTYNTNMQGSAQEILYFTGDTTYGKVSALLVKIKDEDLTELQSYFDNIGTGSSENTQEGFIELLKACKLTKYVDGLVVDIAEDDELQTVGDLYNKIVADFAEIDANAELSSTEKLNAKYKLYAEYINTYDGESGIEKSSTDNYFAVWDECDKTYAVEFAEQGKNFISSNAQAGDLSSYVLYYTTDSTTSQKVISGVHFMLYLGTCSNEYEISNPATFDISQTDGVIEYLNENYYNSMTRETLFDYIYDLLYSEQYSNKYTNYINGLREELTSCNINSSALDASFED